MEDAASQQIQKHIPEVLLSVIIIIIIIILKTGQCAIMAHSKNKQTERLFCRRMKVPLPDSVAAPSRRKEQRGVFSSSQ